MTTSGDDRPRPEDLLDRAYALSGRDDMHALYRDWADTYDEHLVGDLQYSAPGRVAVLLRDHCADNDAPIVDIGCGTGLTGEAIHKRGFSTIDGIDISPEMLVRARSKGIYRALMEADLTGRLDIGDGTYAVAASSGTFTHAHVGADAFDEILRILRPGGLLVCSINKAIFEPMGFSRKIDRLEEAGSLRTVTILEAPLFAPGDDETGLYCVFERP